MRALLMAFGASLAAVVAIVLAVTLLAPAKSVTAAAESAAAVTVSSIEESVRAADNGQIIFRYDTWPDVWGDENGNLNRQNKFHGESMNVDDLDLKRWRNKGDWIQGPMTVVLTVRDGGVTRLKFGIGGARWHHPNASTDLGKVAGPEAARYLLGLASTTTRDDLGESAIVAAVFIRDGDIWDDLFHIARDSGRPEEIRSSALFWIGQEAGERATPELTQVAEDDENADIREAAVFALSQRPESESIPSLTRLARSSRHPGVRKNALFWLAQHDDPKVIDLFEELLAGE